MSLLLQFEGPAYTDPGTGIIHWDANPMYRVRKSTYLKGIDEIQMAKPDGWNPTHWSHVQDLIDAACRHGFRLMADYKTFSELQMQYGVTVPNYSNASVLPSELKYKVCDHEWIDYTGFIEQFTYCRKCDVRK